MQVRQGLAQREGELVGVELPLEHDRHDLGRGARRHAAGGQHHLEAFGVMLAQLLQAGVQAAEWPAVRGQHQRLFTADFEPVERLQVPVDRIGFRFDLPDRHVGGNARQHHVARQHQAVGLAIQRRVFGRMPLADDHAPLPAPDRNPLAVADAPERRRHRRHQPGKMIAASHPDCLELRPGGDAMAVEVARGRVAVGARQSRRQHPAQSVLAHRHPKRRAEVLRQPMGRADMVRVGVGAQDAPDRQAIEAGLEQA